MSGTDVGHSLGHVLADFTDWRGPVRVNDLAPACCASCGRVARPDQPCAILENVLTPEECKTAIEFADSYHAAAPDGLEPGSRSQFISHDPELVALLWSRISGILPEEVDGGTAIGLLPHVAYAKYFPGQVGFPHMDFRHGDKEDPCVSSRISFTVYLNQDFDGGELEFLAGINAEGTGFNEAHMTCVPKVGSAAVFYQGLPQFAHNPLQVRGACKYILRADVLYRFADHDAADVGGTQLAL